MSAFSNRFVVFFYNFSGMHCLKFRNYNFEISNINVLISVFRMFFIFATFTFILKYFNLFSDLYQIKSIINSGMSNFSLILAALSNISFVISTVFIGFIQIFKSKDVLKFMNTCNRICVENAFNDKFEKLTKFNCYLSFTFCLFLAVSNLDFFRFSLYCFFHYPSLFFLAF